MARIASQITSVIKVGDEEVIVTLRKPTNKELNEFLAARYEVGRKNRMKDNSHVARVELFDKLVVKIENLEDESGPVDAGRKEAFPANWKNDIVFKSFEDNEIEVKN